LEENIKSNAKSEEISSKTKSISETTDKFIIPLRSNLKTSPESVTTLSSDITLESHEMRYEKMLTK
jgi:hypothetical protein